MSKTNNIIINKKYASSSKKAFKIYLNIDIKYIPSFYTKLN